MPDKDDKMPETTDLPTATNGSTPALAPVSAPASAPGPRDAQLQWNDSGMTTRFANVVNIQSTREQVDLFFGTNQTWNAGTEGVLTIELSNRMILSPFAAKRLSLALNGMLREYEQRYGALDV